MDRRARFVRAQRDVAPVVNAAHALREGSAANADALARVLLRSARAAVGSASQSLILVDALRTVI